MDGVGSYGVVGDGKGQARGSGERTEPGMVEVVGGRWDVIDSLPRSLSPSLTFDSPLNLGKIVTSIHKGKNLRLIPEYIMENAMQELGCTACHSHLVLLLGCEAKGVTIAGWTTGPLISVRYSVMENGARMSRIWIYLCLEDFQYLKFNHEDPFAPVLLKYNMCFIKT